MRMQPLQDLNVKEQTSLHLQKHKINDAVFKQVNMAAYDKILPSSHAHSRAVYIYTPSATIRVVQPRGTAYGLPFPPLCESTFQSIKVTIVYGVLTISPSLSLSPHPPFCILYIPRSSSSRSPLNRQPHLKRKPEGNHQTKLGSCIRHLPQI